MVKPIKRKRKMTEEQRAAAAERLAKARAARGPSKNLSVHESIRDLPDDHALAPKKVKAWIREQQLKLRSMKSMKNPSRKMTSIVIRMNIHVSSMSPNPPSDEKNAIAISPPPSSLKTSEKAVAPMSIMKIIAVSLTVSIAA